jgi:hypothetical protein
MCGLLQIFSQFKTSMYALVQPNVRKTSGPYHVNMTVQFCLLVRQILAAQTRFYGRYDLCILSYATPRVN